MVSTLGKIAKYVRLGEGGGVAVVAKTNSKGYAIHFYEFENVRGGRWKHYSVEYRKTIGASIRQAKNLAG